MSETWLRANPSGLSTVHIRDLRLFVNAGMSFPSCKAGERLLDLDASCWPIADPHHPETATCKTCIELNS